MSTSDTTVGQSDLASFLTELNLVCIEIGFDEIERATNSDLEQIDIKKLAYATSIAMRNSPAHSADIMLISNWMHAESVCTDAQRDDVRQYYLSVAQSLENSLS